MLSHAWGPDSLGRDNHDRVEAVAQALRDQGVSVWLDSVEMTGNILDSMARAIESSICVVVFVTAKYIDKVEVGLLRNVSLLILIGRFLAKTTRTTASWSLTMPADAEPVRQVNITAFRKFSITPLHSQLHDPSSYGTSLP